MEWVQAAVFGAIVCGFAGCLAILFHALIIPRRNCPNCGGPFPRFTWGGFTCSRCGYEVDRRGRKIEKK
jgi:hypothetical protein